MLFLKEFHMDKHEILQRCFGYSRFRSGQETLIDGILSGRDVFGIMPTGGGKSICYQVPALMLPGVTLVVSPLISLMRDQVMALKASGVPAAFINSTLSGAQMQAVYRNLLAGQYKIVYIAPERLEYAGFGNVAAQLQISFVAVDEAHCISQWGQDFRPSYLRIVNFLNTLPRRPIVGAFTATATKQVREDVERILALQDPVRMVTGFDRPNLSFEVIHPSRKDPELLRLLAGKRNKSGIIYCATRKKVESVCELLKDSGYRATRYHAGLEEEERTANQEDFLFGRERIMVATNAFGMGIDKPDVRWVIHYHMPRDPESYYQEAGRAGRDGTEAECILLYNTSDVTTAKFLIENSSENEELDEEARELIRQQDLERLGQMVGYCKTKDCLRGYILDYFGQKHLEACGNCGNCKGEFEEKNITREAQMILSCVVRVRDKLGYHVGLTTIVRILSGSKDKKLLQLGLERLSTYGLMKDMARNRIRSIADHLEGLGYLQTEPEHQTLQLTAKASQVLYRGQEVTMLVRKEPEEVPESRPAAAALKLSSDETELFEVLRELRADLAREANMPAYMVFSNATLQDMARKKPRTMTDFRHVSGVGELKASWYGEPFLGKIREFLDSLEA